MSLLLIVSPVPTHPYQGGNRIRINNMLQALKDQGHTIHFIYSGTLEDADCKAMEESWDAFYFLQQNKTTTLKWIAKIIKNKFQLNTKRLDQWVWRLNMPFIAKLFKPYLIDDWYNNELNEIVKTLQENNHYDIVIAEYVFFSKVLALFDSQTLKVLDTHDVFANRHLMYINQGKIPHFFYTTPQQELIGINRADAILAIQSLEFEYFKSICDKSVFLVGHISYPKKLTINVINEPVKLLFVGSSSAPNIGAMEFLCNEINFQLKKKGIKFECDIVGNIMPPQIEGDSEFHFTGQVDDLEAYYQKADIVVNPVRIGTGLNIKSIEAISYGKPLITTSIGAQGLNEDNKNSFLIANQADEFVTQIESLINDSDQYKKIADGAYIFAQEYNKKALANLSNLLDNQHHENI